MSLQPLHPNNLIYFDTPIDWSPMKLSPLLIASLILIAILCGLAVLAAQDAQAGSPYHGHMHAQFQIRRGTLDPMNTGEKCRRIGDFCIVIIP